MIDGQIIGQNVYFRGKAINSTPFSVKIIGEFASFRMQMTDFRRQFFLGNFLFIRTSYIQKYKYQLKENPFLSKYFYFCSEPEI